MVNKYLLKKKRKSQQNKRKENQLQVVNETLFMIFPTLCFIL